MKISRLIGLLSISGLLMSPTHARSVTPANQAQKEGYGLNVPAVKASAISTFPWSENFENAETIPEGWTAETPTLGSLNWEIKTFDDPFSTLEGSKRIGIGPRAESDNVARLVMPAFDLSGLKKPVMNFARFLQPDDNMLMLGYSDTLNIYYKTAENAEWQLLGKYIGKSNSAVMGMVDWAIDAVELPQPSADYHIAFEAVSKIEAKSIYIDNIEISDNAVTITQFPWEEHFENNGTNLPKGWSNEQVAGSKAWEVMVGPLAPGSTGQYVAAVTMMPLDNVTRLVSPTLSLDRIKPTLKFKYKCDHNGSPFAGGSDATAWDTIRLYYKTSAETAWKPLGKYTNAPNWNEATIDLPEPTNDYYIAFEAVSAVGGKIIYLDDISIDGPADIPTIGGNNRLDFGQVYNKLTSVTYARSYTIQNTGNKTLEVNYNFLQTNNNLLIEGLPASIAPDETRTITVKLNAVNLPTGSFEGKLILTSNDPENPEFTVNVTATVLSTSTVSPYIEESFDKLMPKDWSMERFLQFTSGPTSGWNNSIPLRAMLHHNAQEGWIQTGAVDMRTDPKITFYYKAMNNTLVYDEYNRPVNTEKPTENNKIKYAVLISNDEGITWHTIKETAFGDHQASNAYVKIEIDAPDYAGDTCLVKFVFTPNLEAMEKGDQINLYFDQVTVGTEITNDLGIVSLSGNQLPSPGETIKLAIDVRNSGSAPQTANVYSVKLFKEDNGNGTEIASANGMDIAKGEIKTFSFDWTAPDTPGDVYLYAEVIFTADGYQDNNRSDKIRIQILPETVTSVTVGDGTKSYKHPINLTLPQSLSQSMYYPNEIGSNHGVIRSLTYQAVVTATDLGNIPVRIWMGETERENLKDGWLDPNTMTEVFNGHLYFTEGEYDIVVPLDIPYEYTGRNIVIYTYRDKAMNGDFYNDFVGTEMPESYRTIGYASYAGDINDPLQPQQFNEAIHGFPNTVFGIDLANTGSLSGTITDNGQPLDKVKVQIDGTGLFTLTDRNGRYSFAHLKAGSCSITASLYGYFDKTLTTTIEADQETTLDFTLGTIPTYTVSGHITGTNVSTGLKGVQVTLTGYKNYTASTDENGNYRITDVYAHETAYNIQAKLKGYLSHQAQLTIDDDKPYDITLDERPYPVESLTVNESGSNKVLTWTKPVVLTERTLTLDDDTYENGVRSPNSGMDVWYGSLFRTEDMGEVTGIELLGLSPTDGSSVSEKTLTVDIFDADRNLIGSSEPFFLPGEGEWIFVSLDNIPYSDAFYAMVKWPTGTGVTNFLGMDMNGPASREGTDWYCDSRSGWAPVSAKLNGVCGTLMIRAHVDADAPKADILQPEPTGYTVYRFLDGAATDDWEQLGTPDAQTLTFTDNGWSSLESGVYRYAVSAKYKDRYSSAARKSGIMGKDMEVKVTVKVNTNAGHNGKGSVINLKGLNDRYNHHYSYVAEGETTVFETVWKGRYALSVEMEGFAPYRDTLDILEASTLELELTELILNPEGLKVEPTGHETDQLFSWNNPVRKPKKIFHYMEEPNYNNMQSVYQSLNFAYGAIFYLDDYPDAILDKVDFYHAQWGQSGIWDYKIHIMEITMGNRLGKPIYTSQRLKTTGDGTWETVNLQPDENLENLGGKCIGVFVEPLSGTATDAYPVICADRTTANQYSYMVNLKTFETTKVTSGGGNFTEYLMNLWIMTFDGKTQKIGRGQDDKAQEHTAKNAPKALKFYEIYLDGNKVAETTDENHTFSGLALNSTHTAGVKAIYSSGSSDMVSIDFKVNAVHNENNRLDGLTLYPNPFTDEIRIDGHLTDIKYIRITTMTGLILKESRMPINDVIYTGDLKPGIYFVIIEHISGENVICKMIKQ